MNKKLLVSIFLCFILFNINQTGYSQTFTSSNLPIVVINSLGQDITQPYIKFVVNMGIIDNGPGVRNNVTDPFNNYNGKAELELHGQSTLNLPKQSYNITPLNASNNNISASLLGLPADKDWIFKGLYQDKTFLRDELAFRIYNQMGHYSSRTRFFELVVDGDYRGVYQIEEKVKRGTNRINISKLKETDISGDALTGGYIISLDKYDSTTVGWYSDFNSNASNDSANFYIYKYPKPDSMPQQQKDYIKNYVNAFEHVCVNPSLFADPVNGYSKYIDVNSFVDNFIINELSKNTDAYRSSTFFYKDKDSKGGKLTASPVWDYNIAFDNCSFNGGDNEYGWIFQWYPTLNFVPFWWAELYGETAFRNKLKCRYVSLRSNVLSLNRLYQHIDSMAVYLNESQVRNFTKWPIMGQVVFPNPSPVPPDYAGEIGKLKYWLQVRLAWMDSNIPGVCQVGINENELAANTVSAFPNPFTNNFTVVYTLNENAKVKIDLLNLLGDVIQPVFEGNKTQGTYQDEIATQKLATGIYMIRFTTNGHTTYQKMVKMDD